MLLIYGPLFLYGGTIDCCFLDNCGLFQIVLVLLIGVHSVQSLFCECNCVCIRSSITVPSRCTVPEGTQDTRPLEQLAPPDCDAVHVCTSDYVCVLVFGSLVCQCPSFSHFS